MKFKVFILHSYKDHVRLGIINSLPFLFGFLLTLLAIYYDSGDILFYIGILFSSFLFFVGITTRIYSNGRILTNKRGVIIKKYGREIKTYDWRKITRLSVMKDIPFSSKRIKITLETKAGRMDNIYIDNYLFKKPSIIYQYMICDFSKYLPNSSIDIDFAND